MVRLEVLGKYPLANTRRISIPVWCDWKFTLNPLLVLQQWISIPVWCDWKLKRPLCRLDVLNFNSSMVRLEVLKISVCVKSDLISIPVWCDWKTGSNWGIGSKLPDFNSSMVRLEASHFGVIRKDSTISIPVWCDWKSHSAPCGRGCCLISIPVWCDWKGAILICVRY